MANYVCTIRTNYFRVKDPGAFREFMTHVYGSEDSVDLWEEKDGNGNLLFGFGVRGGISGLRSAASDEDEDLDENAYDEFIDGLRKQVAEDDAIIILEAGKEAMRYVVGQATIITSKGTEYLNIARLAQARAAAMLGNSDWHTKCEY